MSFTPGPGTTYLLTSTQPVPTGTANGVLYLNGSKVVTSGSALTFDGTNLATTGGVFLNNAQYLYSKTSGGTNIRMLGINSGNTAYVGPIDSGPGDTLLNAASSSANIQFYASGTEQMRLDSTGLGIGTSSPASKLDVNGVISAGGQPAVQSKAYGYSSAYYAVQIGAPGSNTTNVALAVDVSTVAGGQFQGQNQVILPNNGALFVNAAGTDFIGAIRRDSSDRILIGPNTSGGLTLGAVIVDTSGNLGLGVTPSAWGTSAFQTKVASVWGFSNNAYVGCNYYFDGSDRRYIATASASEYAQFNGQHTWYTAPSGTAGNPISFTQAMTLDASGRFLVGTTTAGVGGSANTIFTAKGNADTYASIIASGNEELLLASQTGVTKIGAFSNHPLLFITNNTERARIPAAGGMVVGTAALATTATDGFLYVPTCAGTPTGTPTTQTGTAPIVVDTTNNKLYFYSGGQWRDAGP